MWGLTTEIFPVIEAGLRGVPASAPTSRATSTTSRRRLRVAMARGRKVQVLPAGIDWCGVTFPDDAPGVREHLAALAERGDVPCPALAVSDLGAAEPHGRPLADPRRPAPGPRAGRPYQRVVLRRRRRRRRHAGCCSASIDRCFPLPELVMRNIEVVLAGAAAMPDAAVSLPTLLRTPGGEAWVHDAAGELWRCWAVMPNARSTTKVTGAPDAREAGRAFGAFARLATTLDAVAAGRDDPATFTTRRPRLARLEASIARDADGPGRPRPGGDRAGAAPSGAGTAARGAAPGRRASPTRVGAQRCQGRERALRCRHRPGRHGDRPRHRDAGHAALRLRRPGALEREHGRGGRDRRWARSRRSRNSIDALLEGYLAGTGGLLTPAERLLLEPAGRVITWEQAIRFLTDYLDGDIYFATSHREHNLERARAQLALLASLERTPRGV